MKYWIAGLTALVLSGVTASSVQATVATGPDVCAYTATSVFGVLCPIRNGNTVCLSVSARIGNCDSRLECFGGPGFFCKATLIPKSGPEEKCPFGSVRPRGFNCFRSSVIPPTSTPTVGPIDTETATFTPTFTPPPDTPTGTPTGTADATATVTDTPTVEATVTDTPTVEATVTDTPTVEATLTDTPTPEATSTDTPVAATFTATATGTPTGTADATATATATATGTATGTAAALVLRF
jgi:hypothetical protein